MHSIKQIWGLLSYSLHTLFFSKKFAVFLLVAFLFSVCTFGGLNDISRFYGVKTSAYVFPFFISNPSMLLILGALVIYLFFDVPFTERDIFSVMIRVNRCIYYIAKIMYIFVVSVVTAAFFILASVLSVLPNADFSNQWGKIINTLASSPQTIFAHVNANIGFGVNNMIVQHYTPLAATALSFLLMVLVLFFIGIVIMFCRIMVSGNAAYIVSGFFVSLSYFAAFLGNLSFHGILYFISPFSWISLNGLDIYSSGQAPNPIQAIRTLICAAAVLACIAFLKFYKHDLNIE